MSGTIVQCVLDNWTLVCCGAAVCVLLTRFFGYEKRKSHVPFAAACTLILCANTAADVLIRDTETSWLVTELLLMVCAMGLPYLLLRPRKKMTFFWFGLTLCSVADYLEYVIVSFSHGMTRSGERLVFAVLYGVLLVVAVLLARFSKARSMPDFLENVPVILYLVIFFAEYSTYFSAVLRGESDALADFAGGLRILSATLFVGAVSYMILRYSRQLALQKEEEARFELQLRHYQELMRKSQDVRAFRHDYKNNLFALGTFLESGRTEQARAYIGDLTQSLEKTSLRYRTGNLLADAILSDKASTAEPLGISIEFDGVIGSGIADSDLCAILSNALDNAIEGSRGCAPCAIRVRAQRKPLGLTLTIQNPVSARVAIRGGNVHTKKQDKLNHGFGVANIRRAAEKYDGFVTLSCTDTEFTVEIGLIFKEAEK